MIGFEGEHHRVAQRLDGLQAALSAAQGRIDECHLAPSADVVERASVRLTLSGDHTIVALAGATGSGKSSLFNCLTDLDIAGVGVRRPTTTWALACAWGPSGASELLEWMGIPARHQISRMGLLDQSLDASRLDGLILVDLPDHDSTEIEHRLEMERLLPYSDVLVWVLDPQKYADAAIHERYIRPMAAYAEVTVVVLNQVDRIAPEDRAAALKDVRRLLAEEGLADAPVFAVSAVTGEGMDDLKAELAGRVADKISSRERLTADVATVAGQLAEVGGSSIVPGVTPADLDALATGLFDSVGIAQVTSAIAANARRTAARGTEWPPVRMVKRLRRSPLAAALRGHENAQGGSLQVAQAEQAVRTFAEKASVGLGAPWRLAVRDAVGDAFVSRLDDAVRAAKVHAGGRPWWLPLLQVVQWAAFVVLVGALGWLLADVVDRFVPYSLPPLPMVRGFRLPVLLAVGGLVVGLLVWAFAAFAGRSRGRRLARRASGELTGAVEEVVSTAVVAPVRDELARYETFRAGLAEALT